MRCCRLPTPYEDSFTNPSYYGEHRVAILSYGISPIQDNRQENVCPEYHCQLHTAADHGSLNYHLPVLGPALFVGTEDRPKNRVTTFGAAISS